MKQDEVLDSITSRIRYRKENFGEDNPFFWAILTNRKTNSDSGVEKETRSKQKTEGAKLT